MNDRCSNENASCRSNPGGLKHFLLIALALARLSAAGPAFAATTAYIQLSPAEPGVYVVQGLSLQQVAAIELTVAYDTSGLTGPRVDQGSMTTGAMAAINVNVPGTIRMAFIRAAAMTGTGPIAVIHFSPVGAGPGRITALSAKLATIEGKALPVSTQIINTPEQTPTDATTPAPTDTAGAAEPRQTEQPAPITSGPTYIVPLISIPGEQPTTKQTTTTDRELSDRTAITTGQTSTAMTPDAARPAPSAPEAPSSVPAKKMYTTQSVLDRFAAFKGKKTPENLTALFEQEQAIGFRQEPAVVLTDGKQKTVLRFIASSDRKTADIALIGASLLSLRADPDFSNTWIADVMPAAGAIRASISITQSSFLMVVPLAVAPKVDIDLDRSGSVNEEDFKRFLAEKGTVKEPRFDLNKDGQRDALDEYIFTANYLARTKSSGAAKPAP